MSGASAIAASTIIFLLMFVYYGLGFILVIGTQHEGLIDFSSMTPNLALPTIRYLSQAYGLFAVATGILLLTVLWLIQRLVWLVSVMLQRGHPRDNTANEESRKYATRFYVDQFYFAALTVFGVYLVWINIGWFLSHMPSVPQVADRVLLINLLAATAFIAYLLGRYLAVRAGAVIAAFWGVLAFIFLLGLTRQGMEDAIVKLIGPPTHVIELIGGSKEMGTPLRSMTNGLLVSVYDSTRKTHSVQFFSAEQFARVTPAPVTEETTPPIKTSALPCAMLEVAGFDSERCGQTFGTASFVSHDGQRLVTIPYTDARTSKAVPLSALLRAPDSDIKWESANPPDRSLPENQESIR